MNVNIHGFTAESAIQVRDKSTLETPKLLRQVLVFEKYFKSKGVYT
jgi:hypothetical protein